MLRPEEDYYMSLALEEAREAAACGEVPIGAVIVCDGQVIGRGHNRRESEQNALLHAEICAIDMACKEKKSWRLSDCSLYVTLEPCPMCAGAIINSRLGKLYFGVRDEKGGACGSVTDLFFYPFNHKPQVYQGILEKECRKLLTDFFQTLR